MDTLVVGEVLLLIEHLRGKVNKVLCLTTVNITGQVEGLEVTYRPGHGECVKPENVYLTFYEGDVQATYLTFVLSE